MSLARRYLYPDFEVLVVIPEFYHLTKRFVDLNYGDVLIDKDGNVSVRIMNIDGEIV